MSGWGIWGANSRFPSAPTAARLAAATALHLNELDVQFMLSHMSETQLMLGGFKYSSTLVMIAVQSGEPPARCLESLEKI